MGRIIPLTRGRHDEAQRLLPWYVTGQLEPAELAQVEAHLATCAECQADVALERRLRSEVATLPLDTDAGWLRLRRRLAAPQRPSLRLTPGLRRMLRRLSSRSGLVWTLTAQAVFLAAFLLGVGAVLLSPLGRPAAYRTLGQAPAAASGNVIIIFRPDMPERELRRALLASNARLVGGPTPADAYVLSVPRPERVAALARLRAEPAVVMAEPIDAGSGP
jgi:anti-sigma factor RsiW